MADLMALRQAEKKGAAVAGERVADEEESLGHSVPG